ncbi:MAG: hypothetical protein KME27_11340 [Lyngbya sp. HA4199-MV5]|jgi:hypothetical protein|nr:hypothetical protein [Lyngbya sp. HA4199-MV5]
MSRLFPTSSEATQAETIYPDSDGQPMADNTEQFQWIVVIKLKQWRRADRAWQALRRFLYPLIDVRAAKG